MHSIWTSIKTCQQPLETHKPTGRCVTPTHAPVRANTVQPRAELPAAGVSGPSPGWFPRQALLSAGPSLQGSSAQWAGVRSACSLWAGSQLTVLTWQARFWLPAWGRTSLCKVR